MRRRIVSACSALQAVAVVTTIALPFVTACAPKPIPLPAVSTPRFPEFMQPRVPDDFAGTVPAINTSRGWTFLQAGDLKNAEHEFAAAATAPGFYTAETSFGYLELAKKDPKAAVVRFDRALEREARDVSALVGRGQALLAMNRDNDALASFEAAVAADGSLADIHQRVEVLRFRIVEQGVARARQAARTGRLDEAIQAYTSAIATSPESAFLYRELGAIERRKGNLDAALEHYRKAASLDAPDAESLAQIGDILESRGEFEAAVKAYSDSVAIEPNAAVEKRLDDAREKLAVARLPAEYRAIDQAPQITRADLAALIGVRLSPLLQPPRAREGVLITDVRNNWAATWIVAVARAGVMEPFANHAFQPRAIVRRTDLAQAVARLLARIAARQPGQKPPWDGVRLKFPDLSQGHIAYPAASVAVAAGVMKTGPDNAFEPSRPVTGPESIEAVGKLEAIAQVRTRAGR
jgi:tetratricopeptide (TPR) repeat protein